MTHGCVTATDMCANSTGCVGVLLLLLQLQFGQTRPINFICDPEVRRRMDVTEALEPLTTHCSDQLPAAVLQPCVRINMAAWKQTSLQQKQAFVRNSLDALLHSLGIVKESSSSSCQMDVLKTLERSVKNHLLIVAHLERQTQISTLTPERGCEGQKTASLTQTVRFYRKLLRGPVELLMLDLTHMCTTHTHDPSQCTPYASKPSLYLKLKTM